MTTAPRVRHPWTLPGSETGALRRVSGGDRSGLAATTGIVCAAAAAVHAAGTALREGRMALVITAVAGGYRGDLVLAAERAGAAAIHAMTTLGSGPVYVAMPAATLDRLEVPPADPTATGPNRTLLRMPVSLTGDEPVGPRPAHRAKTIRALIDSSSLPQDFTRPGHVFPLGCGAGGVLSVPEPPQGALDLVEQAGLRTAAVLCEVCGPDGELAGLGELCDLGRRYGLPVVSMDDLVGFRRRELCRVRRCGTARFPLPMGRFRAVGFTDGMGRDHIAFVHGHSMSNVTPLVSVHVECLFGDALGSALCGCGESLDRALNRIASAGYGVLVYIRNRGSIVQRTATAHLIEHDDLQSAFDVLDELGLHEVRMLGDLGDTAAVDTQVRILERIPLWQDAGSARPRTAAAASTMADGMGSAS